jgi:hypothetical protein
MDRDLEERGEIGSEDPQLVDRGKLSRILGMEIPTIGVDSEASFERLMRALDKQRDRQRSRRRLLSGSLGAAIVVIGLITLLRILLR